MLTIQQQIKRYKKAYDTAFALGIRPHYIYYRKRILSLLRQEVKQAQTEAALRIMGIPYKIENDRFYVS